MDMVLAKKTVVIFIAFMLLIGQVKPSCVTTNPLLESMTIADLQLKNSSAITSNHTATEARLNTGVGWCVSNDQNLIPTITIDFGKLVTISKIASQGAYYQEKPYYTSKYSIKFSYSDVRWYDYKEDSLPKEFMANSDAKSTVENLFHKHIMARYLQITPKFLGAQKILCLRFEVYGCPTGLAPVVNLKPSYLKLRNTETGKAVCNVSGQVEMNVQLIKPANDTMSSDSTESKHTSGILHNESRSISFRSPGSMKTFDDSCTLNKTHGSVICKRNYSCKASYLFAKNLTHTKNIQVDFERDVTFDIIINNGRLSPVEASVKTETILVCKVRSQAPVAIRWIHKYKKWAAIIKDSDGGRKEGRLNYVLEHTIYLMLAAKEVINKLKCVVNGNNLVCKTFYVCSAYYLFNTTIKGSQSKEVDFILELPGSADAPTEECQSNNCTISWSAPRNTGDFDKSTTYYKLSVPELNKIVAVNTLKYMVSGLKPNAQYTVELTTQIRNYRGDVLSNSSVVTRQFRTKPIAPLDSPMVSEISSTKNSIRVQWEPMKLLPENGDLLKYHLYLEQKSYGKMPFEKIFDIQPIEKRVNVDKGQSSYTFKALKPWSTYQLSIHAMLTHGLHSKAHYQLISTLESVPTATPSDITEGIIGATYIELQWKAPPFKDQNGKITEYVIKWKRATSGKRISRDISTEKTIRKSASEFKCPRCNVKIDGLMPYTEYVFRIAAVTKVNSGNFSLPKTLRTSQAAPSAPVSLGFDANKTTFYLTWRKPVKLNGIIKEYEIHFRKDGFIDLNIFTESNRTYFDSKMNSSKTLFFKVRAYTEYLHNKGGLAGDWSEWVEAKRKLRPIGKPKDHPHVKHTDPTMTIVISFVVILLLLVVLIVVIFILYRRRQQRKSIQKLEVEMDSVLDDGEDEDINIVPSERLPLTRHLGSHETIDVPVEDHAHRPIPLPEFAEYVNSMRENDDELFYNEYKNELITGKCYPSEIADKQENKPKNRYINITAYDHSRVIVKPDGGKRSSHHHHHHHETDYFNANYIEGYYPESPTKYIASHGPTESVVNDFWRMVWQEKSNVIVMLTNLEEGDKIKCHQYWPSAGASKYGNITVRFHSSDQTADYLVRTFEIEKVIQKEKEKRFVTQFHFVSWPDHGVPEFPTAILSLRRRVRHYYNGHAPMIVHCSAGVGRTGCFILIDAMLERIDNDDGTVDIFNYLQYMRTRRINMVQTLDQYIFAHTAVLEHITFGNTEISVIDLEGRVRELEKNNGIEAEFELIESTSEDQTSDDNVYKVLLKNGKFIDVFYVDGYRQRDAFFICQSPSQHMAPDFWKMMIERECHTIVMLNRLEEENTFKYWPDVNRHATYGDCTILLNSETQNGNIITRKFKITTPKGPRDDYEVQHFQFLDWPAEGIPTNRSSISTLMSLIEKSQQNFGNTPVLVHSGHGAGRSGTFIAIYNSTERLKLEQLIDVVQCVRAVRTAVANAVETPEQYRFIYNMIQTYLEAFETYANFHDPCPSYDNISIGI